MIGSVPGSAFILAVSAEIPESFFHASVEGLQGERSLPVPFPALHSRQQLDAVIDPKAKDQDTVALITYLAESQKFEKLLENQQVLRQPIVRNGRQATVGYEPDVWKTWE